MTTPACTHPNFAADCKVMRFEGTGRFALEVTVKCTACESPFQFLGLPPGYNYEGPTVSLDGLEANLPICAEGLRPNPLQHLQGQTVNAVN